MGPGTRGRSPNRKENPTQKPSPEAAAARRLLEHEERERERERERAAKGEPGVPAMEFVDALTGFRIDGRRPNEVIPT